MGGIVKRVSRMILCNLQFKMAKRQSLMWDSMAKTFLSPKLNHLKKKIDWNVLQCFSSKFKMCPTADH